MTALLRAIVLFLLAAPLVGAAVAHPTVSEPMHGRIQVGLGSVAFQKGFDFDYFHAPGAATGFVFTQDGATLPPIAGAGAPGLRYEVVEGCFGNLCRYAVYVYGSLGTLDAPFTLQWAFDGVTGTPLTRAVTNCGIDEPLCLL